jgi:branched-chain amino acid transport system permease protein
MSEISTTGTTADDLETSEAPPTRSRWEALSPHDSEGRKRIIGIVIAVVAIAALFTDPQAIQAVILGAGSGALIAALALGVVVTYRGSGVVNIGTGALAMYASYVFVSLNEHGDLLLIAWTIHLGGAWSFAPALIGTLVVTGALGGVLYLLIFAPLGRASPVAKLVASVGVLLVLQSIIILHYGALPLSVSATLSSKSITLSHGIIVPGNQLILTVVVIIAALVLWVIYRFTRFGLATRAAAEDERHLTLLGHSPLMVSGGNWVFSGIVVALFAVLTAPIDGSVDPSTITLLIIPAVAAALVGRFTSFGWATVAGLAIGMFQALLQYLATKSWFPTVQGQPIPGIQESVPLVIILVALVLQRRGVGGRGAIGNVRLPFAPSPKFVLPKLGVGLAIGVVGFLVLSSDWRLAEINTIVGVAICLSFVILTGFVGQVSLAQMVLAGVSGFTVAKLSASAGIDFPFAPIIGALAAVFVGLIAGFPALRVRGVQLAIVTLAAAYSIQTLIFTNPAWSGGLAGANVPAPSFIGLHFGPTTPTSFGDGNIPNPFFGMFCLVVVVLLCGGTSALRGSAWGRRMLAVRANERAAASAGVSVEQTKLVAFAISAFVAGLAGALSGYRFGSVTPDYFGVLQSLSFLAFAYMGGISSVTGAVIAGFLVTNGLVFTALQNWVGISPDYTILIGGLGLIATVVLNPDGIAGTWRVIGARYRARTGRDGGAAPPEEGLLVPEPPPQPTRPEVPAIARSTSTSTEIR